MPTLYHYTSLDALVSIVSHGTLRFTDYRYLNDSSEFSLFQSYSRVISEQFDKYLSVLPIVNADLPIRPCYVCDNYASRYFGEASRRLEVANFLGVFCLSRAKDDLSQWRAYAGNPVGVALQFDRERLGAIALPYGYQIVDCTYSIEDFRSYHELQNRLESLSADVYCDTPETIAEVDGAWLLTLAGSLKDEAFISEKEVRVVSPPLDFGGRANFRVPDLDPQGC